MTRETHRSDAFARLFYVTQKSCDRQNIVLPAKKDSTDQ